jgi:hypothetical protein
MCSAAPANPATVSDPSARGWEAVDHAEERLRTRAQARRRAADRRRRRWCGIAWALRVLLPLAGAAGALALLEGAGGDLRDLSAPAAAVLPAAILLVPALVAGAIARRDGALEAVLWALVTLAAELALLFAVGLVALGLGPR